MAAYDEVKHILRESAQGGEKLTTIGEVELSNGEYDPSPLVRLVVKGEDGEPVVMTGELLSQNGYFREALVKIGGGFSEFSYDCPALLISVSSESKHEWGTPKSGAVVSKSFADNLRFRSSLGRR